MAVKKTKKLNEQAITTAVAPGEKFAKVDANGKVTLIELANLKNALSEGGIDLFGTTDGVFIMFHANDFEDCPLMVKPYKWPELQRAGEIADGVVVVEAGKMLVVAPTMEHRSWSSGPISGGATTTEDRVTAINDWNGKANTASIIAASRPDAVTEHQRFAPGFCNMYSRTNANGRGLTAGKWWLPSVGEMMMIYANMTKINYCLGLISGANLLDYSLPHWTSTEFREEVAWIFGLNDGSIIPYGKIGNRFFIRPVSAFME